MKAVGMRGHLRDQDYNFEVWKQCYYNNGIPFLYYFMSYINAMIILIHVFK